MTVSDSKGHKTALLELAASADSYADHLRDVQKIFTDLVSLLDRLAHGATAGAELAGTERLTPEERTVLFRNHTDAINALYDVVKHFPLPEAKDTVLKGMLHRLWRCEEQIARSSTKDAASRSRPPDGDLLRLWNYGANLCAWRRAIANAQADGNVEDAQIAQEKLDQLRQQGATPLRALKANAKLVARLTGERWFVMRDAREQGATWDEIAEALGLTAEDARAFYLNAIEDQERDVTGDLYTPHDARRSRAAL